MIATNKTNNRIKKIVKKRRIKHVVKDPIADFILRINNASRARHSQVLVYFSKMNTAMLEILTNEGFIKGYKVIERSKPKIKMYNVELKYSAKTPVINGMKQISKPGLRVYQECKKIPKVLNGLGIAIISTSKGIMIDKQARENNLGGEVIAYVW